MILSSWASGTTAYMCLCQVVIGPLRLIKTLRQNGPHFTDNIFKCIFLNENVRIPIEISLKFVPKGPFNYIPALVQIMAWHRRGDTPLSEPMMVRLPMHICITQWIPSINVLEDWFDFLCIFYLIKYTNFWIRFQLFHLANINTAQCLGALLVIVNWNWFLLGYCSNEFQCLPSKGRCLMWGRFSFWLWSCALEWYILWNYVLIKMIFSECFVCIAKRNTSQHDTNQSFLICSIHMYIWDA